MTAEERFSQARIVLDDIQSRLGLIENYLSCLKLQSKQPTKDLVLYSLLHEQGFENMLDILSKIQDDLCLQNNFLVDYCESMEVSE